MKWICTSLWVLAALPLSHNFAVQAQKAQVGDDEAMRVQILGAMDRLRAAQAWARGTRTLPFTLRCTDEENAGACRDGGRAALASLPLDRIRSVRPIYNTTCARVVFEYPEDQCPAAPKGQGRTIDAWQFDLPYAGGRGYTWIVGLAPAGGLAAVELERGFVFYH